MFRGLAGAEFERSPSALLRPQSLRLDQLCEGAHLWGHPLFFQIQKMDPHVQRNLVHLQSALGTIPQLLVYHVFREKGDSIAVPDVAQNGFGVSCFQKRLHMALVLAKADIQIPPVTDIFFC